MVQKHRYGVVLDAGSSGTRAYVYRYKTAEYVKSKDDTKELARLPKIKTKGKEKVKPGISTFGEKPDRVGPDHLKSIVDYALEKVPEDEVQNTPIFLLATAGMRLLPDNQQQAVLSNVCSYLKQNYSFQLPDCDVHIQVIPGEQEGLYGWIAANYLLGGFDEPEKKGRIKEPHTYGFLDLGGASAQIAFAPNATEAERHANDLTLLRMRTVDGHPLEYGVFVTTWLGFGVNVARRKYVEHLLEASPNELEVTDPCLPKGLLSKSTGELIESGSPDSKSHRPHLLGTGKFSQCVNDTLPLLEKQKQCNDPPCLINGIHTPDIDFANKQFVGVSEYWHITHDVFAEAHQERAYDFETYQKQVTDLCSRSWKDIEKDLEKKKWDHKVDEKTLEEVCFKASWLINMLHEGIGVPRVGLEKSHESVSGDHNKTNAILDGASDKGFSDPFQAGIDGGDVSWTLGKMVLYASSQMPPTKGAMAVGFGSNVPGSKTLPSDFQHASGQQGSPPKDSEGWRERILGSSYSRRVPGLVIFLLILAFAAYLLCGRERRLNIWHKLTGQRTSGSRPRRRKGGPGGILSSKLFGTNEPAYERVLEDAVDPDEFELSDVNSEEPHSDSSNSSHENAPKRNGRTSGWTTPAAGRNLSPDFTRSSPKRNGYVDVYAGSSSGRTGNGLGITPLGGGLMVRAESKEMLAPAPTQLGRNRSGSPRRSPLIAPLKENVD